MKNSHLKAFGLRHLLLSPIWSLLGLRQFLFLSPGWHGLSGHQTGVTKARAEFPKGCAEVM
jgi:hypothetical protein